MSFDDLVEAFRAVENSYLAQFESNQFLALETRRRVAEMMLKAATFKCCPLESCRAHLDNLFRLGFTNLERKVTMCIFFAQYCRETGIPQQGIDVLEPVEAELNAELNRPRMPPREREFYQHILGQTQVTLGKLRDSLKREKAE
jgi:hypothetical protein